MSIQYMDSLNVYPFLLQDSSGSKVVKMDIMILTLGLKNHLHSKKTQELEGGG